MIARVAAVIALAVCASLQASPRGDLLFEINGALKARDGAAFAHCFNFQGADDATRQSFVRMIGEILAWPSFYVFTSERKDEGGATIEQDGKPYVFNGDWKYQVHIFLAKDSKKGFVFPAGTVVDGKDRILVAIPAENEAMKIVVTCGPAIAPIDEVRRITNFSTGELGVMLANAFAAAGYEVVCLRGEAATSPLPAAAAGVDMRVFSTNGDLAAKLGGIGAAGAVFHTAALCDYEVDDVRDGEGDLQSDAKIPSRAGALILRLKPAQKVLPQLRVLFPGARIVGWKYELNGTREDALTAGRRQLAEARGDLCVVNGAAYGQGFGLLAPNGEIDHAAGRQALCDSLVRWVSGTAR